MVVAPCMVWWRENKELSQTRIITKTKGRARINAKIITITLNFSERRNQNFKPTLGGRSLAFRWCKWLAIL